MDARPHTETCRTRLEEELAKDNGPRWMKAKAREMARTAADAGLARAREESDKKRRVEEEAEEEECRSSAVEPSSSKDHVRERPVESEEEDDDSKKKSKIADATGQKRKEAATTPSHSRAKAKVADPVGSKRKSSKGAEATPSPSKTKMTEQSGEKRKADSDAEDVEEAGPGSPLRSRVGEDEDLRRVTTALRSTYNILQLHSDSESDIISEAGKFEMTAMDLGGLDIDSVANREKITEWVRERKPAFIVGRPQNKSIGHIRFICGLYQLQVREGRWFAHEQLEDSVTWEMKEVVGLKEVEGVFDSNQCVRKSTGGRSSMRVMTNSKCMADELHLRYDDQQAKQKPRDGNI